MGLSTTKLSPMQTEIASWTYILTDGEGACADSARYIRDDGEEGRAYTAALSL